MKFLMLINNITNAFKTRLIRIRIRNKNKKENIIHQHPQSDELEKKLALLIKDIEAVDQADLKQVQYTRMKQETKENILSSFRLDFHTRIELNIFKKKYKSLLL